MIPGINKVSRNASVASSQPLSGGFRGQSPLRKFLGSNDHLNWLKINLNADEINEDYKRTKINVNGSTHIQC